MISSNARATPTRIVIYTDGSCAPTNPGPGGWAYLSIVDGSATTVVSGSQSFTTNNRMELTAAIEALRSCHDEASVELHTDSEYVRLGITQWVQNWKRNRWERRNHQEVLNKDLWCELDAENERVEVQWHWVKAHAGHEFNDWVDEAARNAAVKAKESCDCAVATETISVPFIDNETLDARDSYFVAAVSESSGMGRCAWAVVRLRGEEQSTECGFEPRSTLNRTLLMAAISTARSLQVGERVSFFTDSEYLYRGATQWLTTWKRRDWRKSDNNPVLNRELWIALDADQGRTDIDWRTQLTAESEKIVFEQARSAARDELTAHKSAGSSV